MSDLDAAVGMAAASIVRATEPPALQLVTVGTITQMTSSGPEFLAWVAGVVPDTLTISTASMSSVFLAETRVAGVGAMVGRRVVVLFASNQALILDTLGV